MKVKPSRKERDHFYAYVGEVARQMWLGSWTISHKWSTFEDVASDGILRAVADFLPQYRSVTITWSSGFLKQSPREIRDSVVHELLHCHHGHIDRFIERTLEGYSEEARAIQTVTHHNLTEEHIVVMELLIAEHMPAYEPYVKPAKAERGA